MMSDLSIHSIRAWYERTHGPLPALPAVHTSREVNALSVNEVLTPVIVKYPDAPLLGTPQWCELRTDSPELVAAVFAAARAWAWQRWLEQDAMAQASAEVARSRDWGAEGRFLAGRASSSYIPRAVSA